MKTTSPNDIFRGSKALITSTLLTMTILTSGPAYAGEGSCHLYEVTLQGVAAIGDGRSSFPPQQFTVSQYAVLRETGYNGNAFEFSLNAGRDLNAAPQLGLVELGTNSRMVAHNAGIKAAAINLASVAVQNGGGAFQVDGGASYRQPSPNVFVAPGYNSVPGGLGGLCNLNNPGLCDMVTAPNSVLGASYLVPRTGTGYFRLTKERGSGIVGEIRLVGSSLDNAGFQGQYQARFAGRYAGDVQCQ